MRRLFAFLIVAPFMFVAFAAVSAVTVPATQAWVQSGTATLTNKTVNCANNTCTVRAANDVTGQLPAANGGTGQNWSASSGIPKVASGTFSLVTAPSGAICGDSDTQTLTNKTVNCANNTCTVRAASDITGQLPTSKGGTGQDWSASTGIPVVSGGTFALATAPSSYLVGTSDTQTLINKTIDCANNTCTVRAGSDITGQLATSKGGTGQDWSASSGIPKLASGTASLVTAPSGTIVGTSDTQTLTNKTIDCASNTCTFNSANIFSGIGWLNIAAPPAAASWTAVNSGASLAIADRGTSVEMTIDGTDSGLQLRGYSLAVSCPFDKVFGFIPSIPVAGTQSGVGFAISDGTKYVRWTVQSDSSSALAVAIDRWSSVTGYTDTVLSTNTARGSTLTGPMMFVRLVCDATNIIFYQGNDGYLWSPALYTAAKGGYLGTITTVAMIFRAQGSAGTAGVRVVSYN